MKYAEPSWERRKRQGLYHYSSREFDTIAEVLLLQYDKKYLNRARPFPIEEYVELYQGINVEYLCLSPDMSIFGCSVAVSGNIPVWNMETQSYEDAFVKENTIVIEERLVTGDNPLYKLILRFVLAHEMMHLLLQEKYLTITKDRLPSFHTDENHYRTRLVNTFTDDDIIEWQANRGAISILMPLKSVMRHIDEMIGLLPLYDVIPEIMISEIAKTYQVTRELAFYRLVDLPKFVQIFGKVEFKDLEFAD